MVTPTTAFLQITGFIVGFILYLLHVTNKRLSINYRFIQVYSLSTTCYQQKSFYKLQVYSGFIVRFILYPLHVTNNSLSKDYPHSDDHAKQITWSLCLHRNIRTRDLSSLVDNNCSCCGLCSSWLMQCFSVPNFHCSTNPNAFECLTFTIILILE